MSDEHVTFARVTKAEWIKFRTVRSTWLTLDAAVALMVIIGLVIGYNSQSSARKPPSSASWHWSR